MGKVQYIGVPTKLSLQSFAQVDACEECRKENEAILKTTGQSLEDCCPECTSKRTNGIIYIPTNHPKPFIGEFHAHPDGVMAEINGRSTFVRMTLERFLDRFKDYIDVVEEGNIFKDHLRKVSKRTKTEAKKLEKVFPKIIHSNWENLSERERQVATITALRAIDIIDAIRTIQKDAEQEKGDRSQGEISNSRSTPKLSDSK